MFLEEHSRDGRDGSHSFFSLRWTASWKSPSILHACTTFIAHCSAEETMLPRMDGVIRRLSRFAPIDLESCEHTLELPENTPDSREVKPDGLRVRLGWRGSTPGSCEKGRECAVEPEKTDRSGLPVG